MLGITSTACCGSSRSSAAIVLLFVYEAMRKKKA
jgi:hypothetical protein